MVTTIVYYRETYTDEPELRLSDVEPHQLRVLDAQRIGNQTRFSYTLTDVVDERNV